MRTRFAPSPTGHLHLGHVAHALIVWGWARTAGAEVLLRIEDHDLPRCKPEYTDSILDDLKWLGLTPHLQADPFRQSQQPQRYQQALNQLQQQGLLYACDCSRADLQRRWEQRLGHPPAKDTELPYDGHCRNRNLPFTGDVGLRVRLPETACTFTDLLLGPQTQQPSGDTLLRDHTGLYTYQLCVVVDDLHHAITHIVRGQDILASTARQLALRQLLAPEAQPLHFLHHPLILAPDGRKLSKRNRDAGLVHYRQHPHGARQAMGDALAEAGLLPESYPPPLEEVWEVVALWLQLNVY